MQKLAGFISKYKEFITFILLVIISFSLISAGDVSKIGGYRAFIIGTYGQLQKAFSWIPNPGALESENKALRRLNLELSSEVARMRNSLFENERLRKLLDFKDNSEYNLKFAQVIGKSTVEMRNYISIDRGTLDSIDIGMPVRTDAGLVGIIVTATDNFSLVETLPNRNVKVASKILRTGYDGILTWNGEKFFKLKNIPNTYDVEKGDIVLTSNLSNKYPEDVPIGTIIKVADDQSSLFYDITVESFVDFDVLNEVFVIRKLPNPERIKLIKQIEEKLKLQKK